MNTTAAIFFLILGQAGGMSTWDTAGSGGLTVIPSHYTQLASCEAAGEAARANNQGLSFLSYTCVPGEINVGATPTRFEVLWPAKPFAEAGVSKTAACDEVCELIEAQQ